MLYCHDIVVLVVLGQQERSFQDFLFEHEDHAGL